MKNVYKVRHKPTGLFYSPGSNSNLSKNGKVYTTKNTIITLLKGGYTTTLRVNSKLSEEYKSIIENLPKDKFGDILAKETDFELVEFKLT
ncbi:MAG: hypothetical protein IKO36_12445 [Bacteroidaceae bacterium]|nr:hypothetical protein [Bacteroidaceae bacterium]